MRRGIPPVTGLRPAGRRPFGVGSSTARLLPEPPQAKGPPPRQQPPDRGGRRVIPIPRIV